MLKSLGIPVAFLLGASVLPAFGQTQTAGPLVQSKPAPQYVQNAQQAEPVPDDVTYLEFFRWLRSFENRAHRDYAAGDQIRSEAWHSYVRTEARLTGREAEILKAVAADCVEKAEAIQRTWQAAHPRLRPPLDEATAKELKAAREAYAQMILEHVDQLRTAFGPKRFPKLDRYARYQMRNIKMFDEKGTQN